MKLEFVEISGFRGFRDKVRFDLARGFTVLSGHNGTGKSTVLDAIDFALTGTINKFSVKAAKGGGLDEHIWWVGSGKAETHSVSVGFVNDDEERFVVTRSRESGCNVQPSDILTRLCSQRSANNASVETLLQTTLIRDEFIAGLSLDLPEQTRFTLVREAIGSMVGPDYSARTAAILNAANGAKSRQDDRIKEIQSELGRTLGELTDARSLAERSADLSEALKIIESLPISLPAALGERVETVQRVIAERRLVLQQLDAARAQMKELDNEVAFFSSANAKEQMEGARSARGTAARNKTLADERLALANRADVAEKESDEFATHISAILEHGEAVGLIEGHCPLCDAARTQPEFTAAIAATKARLAARGERLTTTAAAVAKARSEVASADQTLAAANKRYTELEERRLALERSRTRIHETYSHLGIKDPPGSAKAAEELLFREQASLVRLERAFAILETSNALDKVKSLENRVAQLRERAEQEAAKLSAIERAVEAGRQMEAAAKTVANEILMEQFDTVMPLIKELYRRLRPHADWTEIESDFGGKVRGSLNFVVGDGHNPQFLFSSGQRRAAGLAFLLAVHLSRPWCGWHSLLLDDPVQHIDDYRALNLVEALTAIRRTNRQVIVAVEDSALADLLCRRLRSESDAVGRIFELQTSKTGAAEIAKTRHIYPMPRLVLREAQAS
jgi:DNA repair exonuclease SbcCD ATPase subunit